MDMLQWFLLFLALVIVAFLISIRLSTSTVGVWEQNELNECSKEITRIVGSAEKVTSLKVLDKIMPYLKEVESSDLENHLEKYYNDRELRALRDDAENDTLAPKKYKYLHTLIADIIRRNNISSVEEFLKKSKLTYVDFLPNTHKQILEDNMHKLKNPTKEDMKKISKVFDKYFVHEGVYMTKSKLLDAATNLTRMFKLKSGRARLDPEKLEASIDRDPSKVLELDYIGLIPEMYEKAIIAANAKPMSSSYNKRDFSFGKSDEELRRQFERDVETLRLLRDYPNTTRRELERLEIVRRLEKAASSLYSPRYVTTLLRDLYYDYPSRRYDYGRASETFEERERRIRMERERDESEKGRKAALTAQEAADKAVAEGIVREETAKETYEKNLEKAEEVRKQLIKEQAELAKLHTSDVQDLQDQGPKPDFAAQGLDPELEELWKMGAKEGELLPLIPLN